MSYFPITYDEAKALRRTMRNPWLAVALDRVMSSYRGYERQAEFIATVLEYRDSGNEKRPCPTCGGTLWRRSTVGALQCPDCRTMLVWRKCKTCAGHGRHEDSTVCVACEGHGFMPEVIPDER